MDKLTSVAWRNRPSRKPQLWEDLPLALRRRLKYEVSLRFKGRWLDEPQLVELSQVGFDDAGPPLQVEIVPRDLMNKALFLYGTFEISETRLVQALLRPGMTVIDVGANVGYYTLIAARLVGPGGLVHSFEPNGVVREQLQANVHRNGFTNVRAHDSAVARHTGHVKFYVSTNRENSGTSSIVPGAGLAEEGVDVPCISLDDFATELAPRSIDLLKIDIEGAELDVFEGGRRLLGGPAAPDLLFESFKVERLLDLLGELGYQVRRLHYTLRNGLELPRSDEPIDNIFAAYEPPNYFAVKDPSRLDEIVRLANARRSQALHWLGSI
jgi:FkbM family methyltransferase